MTIAFPYILLKTMHSSIKVQSPTFTVRFFSSFDKVISPTGSTPFVFTRLDRQLTSMTLIRTYMYTLTKYNVYNI